MLPGKKYKPEDYLKILWTHKWLLIIPTILAGAGAFIYASTLPDRYRSATTILVVPQRVPTSYVRPTVTASLAERLRTISQEIMSRSRLERIIEEFNLYREERKTMIMEDVVEQMRTRDIRLDVSRAPRGQQARTFTVGFESAEPRTAMQVAERLASMFVQENMEERELLADATSQFLQAQLEDARRRLNEFEAKLVDFRQKNSGRLPSQVQSNLQMMQSAQQEVQENTRAATQEQERIASLERSINETVTSMDAPLGATTPEPAVAGGETPRNTQQNVAAELRAAQANLAELERRGLRADHPDVGRARRQVADLELKAQTAAPAVVPARGPGGTNAMERVAAWQKELEQLRNKQEQRRASEERLREKVAGYAARLEAAPELEFNLTDMMRDYGTVREQYESLLKKSEESKLAANLERRQIGEQFRIIDGARLPLRPSSPNRQRINTFGIMGGLAFGLLVIGLLEYRDTRLRTDEDVVTSLALPVLAVIPVMITAGERRRYQRRRLIFAIAATAAVVLVAVAAAAWKFRVLQQWVR